MPEVAQIAAIVAFAVPYYCHFSHSHSAFPSLSDSELQSSNENSLGKQHQTHDLFSDLTLN